MELAERIGDLVRPTIEALGYSVVRVQVLGRQRLRVQIMAEPSDGRPMMLDDCARVSQAVSAVLDVQDPIASAYTLEVSSPGIDRPLVRREDYLRFAGYAARIEMSRPIDGRRRFQGRLVGLDGDLVRVDLGGSEVGLPFPDILRAKLVLTDDLLAAAPRAEDGDEREAFV